MLLRIADYRTSGRGKRYGKSDTYTIVVGMMVLIEAGMDEEDEVADGEVDVEVSDVEVVVSDIVDVEVSDIGVVLVVVDVVEVGVDVEVLVGVDVLVSVGVTDSDGDSEPVEESPSASAFASGRPTLEREKKNRAG